MFNNLMYGVANSDECIKYLRAATKNKNTKQNSNFISFIIICSFLIQCGILQNK